MRTSAKLTDMYEELVFLEQQGELNFAGQRELEVTKHLLFGSGLSCQRHQKR